MSPAKSQAQFRMMHLLFRQGKITKAELDRYVDSVSYKRLPERVKKKRRTKR